MKIILKILFFLLTVFHTNIVEAKICVVNIESKKESKQISEIGLDLSCKSESSLLDYRSWAKGYEANAAKGVTNGLSKTISVQKQARHIAGTAKPGGGFLFPATSPLAGRCVYYFSPQRLHLWDVAFIIV